MNRISRFFNRAYCIIFALFATNSLLSLLNPTSDSYIYYLTISTLHTPAFNYYQAAILRAFITFVCIIPLFTEAFNLKKKWRMLFLPLFFIRILADIMGHNYEWLDVRALSHTENWLGIVVAVIYLAFLFPSYRAHFKAAFNP